MCSALTVQPQGITGPANDWLNQLLISVRTLPGVEAAGAVYLRPLMLGPIGQGVLVRLEGQPEAREAAEANPVLNHQIATPGYFETMRIPLRAGRLFTDSDTAARRAWRSLASPRPGVSGRGRMPSASESPMSSFTPGGPRTMWRTIVGVVSDVRYRGIDEVQLDVYDAALQTGRPADNIVVRTSGDPLRLAPAIRDLARRLDPSSTIDEVTTH